MHSLITQRVMSVCISFSIFLQSGAYSYWQPIEIDIPEETIEIAVEEVVDQEIEDDIVIVEPEEPVETIEPEPTYYVDIVDGYITEDSLQSICKYVGDMYDISPELLQAIAWNESRYKVRATSHCNAKGVCQIMEKWHKDRMKRLAVTDLYDPYSSVLLCADLIAELSRGKYGDDIRFVLMAYNMGQSGAMKPYKSGKISSYAIKVLDKMEELQSKNSK